MLTLDRLTRTYPAAGGGLTVLHEVSLTIATGEVAAIVGPSGSGKSTLLGLVAGLDDPTSGRVLVDGRDLAELDEGARAEFRNRTMGFLFQSYRLLPTLTAAENVRVPLELAGRVDAAAVAASWLERVGLTARADHRPVQLSGGEQQRVALARALANGPRLLFADEPTGNLDGPTGTAIADLLVSLARAQGTTCLLVTHDPSLAARADRVIRLRDGRVEA